MFPGPVFSLEVITSSRRARYFVARTGLGLILLALIAISYDGMASTTPDRAVIVTGRRLASFARGTFEALSVAQLVVVVTLTPALFAGAIAEEKQRGTLLYLMGSSLSSAEIIVGKLGARFLHVLAAIGVAFPILSCLTLLGGVPPSLVVGIEVISVSTAILLAAASLLVSVYSRRVGEALLVVYLIEVVWLLILPWLPPLVRWYWPAKLGWIASALEWGVGSNPFVVWWGMASTSDLRARLQSAGWSSALQGFVALAWLAIAVARLRPVFRNESTERRNTHAPGLRSRRPGDRDTRFLDRYPMLWKETRRPRRGRLARVGWGLAAVVMLLVLSYWGILLGLPAAREMFKNGFGQDQNLREDYNIYVRVGVGFLSVAWVLGLAATSASCITTEKEEETWLSLRATLLQPLEILAAKLLGSIWRLRLIGGCMLWLWTSGLILGAVHPFGYLAVVLAWVVYSGFLVALGTYVSLGARATLRATVLTLAIVIFVNVGYMLFCAFNLVDFPLLSVGCMPALLSMLPMTYAEVESLVMRDGVAGVVLTDVFFTIALSVVGYGVAGALLVLGAFLRLDAGSQGKAPWPPTDRRRPPAPPAVPTRSTEG